MKEIVKAEVIHNHQVLPLGTLRDRYVIELDIKGTANPNYRSTKLMARLEKDDELNKHICFAKVSLKDRGCYAFWLVYSSSITLADAISCSYQLGAADQVKDTALYLRQLIQKAFKESADLPWPPTADEVGNRATEELPDELKVFLNLVMSGCDAQVENCERTHRLVYSIGQDICRGVTNGQWKLSKHMLLCTTIRHLYRSRQLTTILNRLGHCESYDFGLELETSIAKALEDKSTHLTPQIVCGEGNIVFHSEWNNLNKITTNIHGSNVVNSAGGIMIQETVPGTLSNTERTLPLYDRNKQRSLTVDTPKTLPPVTIYNRVNPKFPENAIFSSPDNEVLTASLQEYYIWLLCRYDFEYTWYYLLCFYRHCIIIPMQYVV